MSAVVEIHAGDTVRHIPSGETWSVAAAPPDGTLYAEGWPCTRAQQADVELVERASPEERLATLRTWAAYTDGDPRAGAARRELVTLTLAQEA